MAVIPLSQNICKNMGRQILSHSSIDAAFPKLEGRGFSVVMVNSDSLYFFFGKLGLFYAVRVQ